MSQASEEERASQACAAARRLMEILARYSAENRSDCSEAELARAKLQQFKRELEQELKELQSVEQSAERDRRINLSTLILSEISSGEHYKNTMQ